MKQYFELDLDVPGSPAAGLLIDQDAEVIRFVFDGWSGDQLVTGGNVFLATESLAQKLRGCLKIDQAATLASIRLVMDR